MDVNWYSNVYLSPFIQVCIQAREAAVEWLELALCISPFIGSQETRHAFYSMTYDIEPDTQGTLVYISAMTVAHTLIKR